MQNFLDTLGKVFTPIKFVLAEDQIGLLYKDKQFVGLLTSGKHLFNRWRGEYSVKTIQLNDHNGLQEDADILFLARKYPEQFADTIQLVTTDEHQLAFIKRKGVLVDVLPPASEGFLWRYEDDLSIDMYTIEDNAPIEKKLWQRIKQCPAVWLRLRTHKLIHTASIAAQHIGLHYVNQQFVQTFASGEYAWWTVGTEMNMLEVDLRLQNIDISGQEILTKDRVSIRLNLLATWQISDAEKLVLHVKNYNDYLYREMQLALRTVVATKTLDELLADKNLLNDEIKYIVLPIATAQGITVQSVGVKDIILPGEMKEILSKVVEAQKLAEANSIKLREETQSTRSLHNTAKVMENNPMLLRLKELEALERITAQIHQLNVYGGLDEVMYKLVNLRGGTSEQEQ